MAITFNAKAFEHAKMLIKHEEFERCKKNDVKEHQPTHDEVDYFVDHHNMQEYGLWFLGLDSKFPSNTIEHYIFPYGDLKEVHICILEKSAQEGMEHKEIGAAARTLLDLMAKHKM